MKRRFSSSLQWRMTAWYGGALMLVLLLFAAAMLGGVWRALMVSAAQRVDGVSAQIAAEVRQSGAGPFGPVAVVTALSEQETLDRVSGPGLYIEAYTPQGFTISKSYTLGSSDLPPSGYRPWKPPAGSGAPDQHWGVGRTALGPVLAHWQTFSQQGVPIAVVYVAESLDPAHATLRGFGLFLLLGLALTLLIVAAASAWLARAAIGPINEISRAAREIGGEDLAKRLNWQGRDDELGTLAATFDEMLSRLEAAFARERRFIADASHELKTPLTVINANAQMLNRWADRDDLLRRESLETIRAESAAMARVINAMLTLAKTEPGAGLALERLDLTATVRDVGASMRQQAAAKGLRLEVEAAGGIWINGEPGLIRQLVLNLTENAIKFTSQGCVTLALRLAGMQARLEVRDTGPGIAESALPHVFDRFFRADPARSRAVDGTGLGLAVARAIVKAHGGTIEVRSDGQSGTVFEVRLTALPEAAAAQPASASGQAAAGVAEPPPADAAPPSEKLARDA